MALINIYCDESCHLEHDNSPVMVLGCIRFPYDKKDEINKRIKEIKGKYGVPPQIELKWTKLSPSLVQCYQDLVNYFFDDDDLCFRGLVIDNKKALNHSQFNQTHDDWYYKIYFNMLKTILNPSNTYNIYLDIKDTRSKSKVSKLHEVLSNNNYDFSRKIIKRVQTIRSHEVQIMQIVDILIGAISYFLRNLDSSNAKLSIINLIKSRSKYSLNKNTLFQERKFNLFHEQLEERK